MNYYQLQNYFLLGLLLIVIALFSWMMLPYLIGITLALISVIVAWPLHGMISRKIKNPSFAALVTTLVVIVVILIPLIILSAQLINEFSLLYQHLQRAGYQISTLDNLRVAIEGRIQEYVPGLAFSLPSFDLSQYAELSTKWLATKGFGIAGNAASIIFNGFVFLFGLFYLFRDGEKLRKVIMNLSLLSDENDKNILDRAGETINAVVRGSLATALAQGLLAAIGFKLFGIPSPMLWGFITMFMSLIPGIGTAVVLFPAVIYLFVTGHTLPALGLLVWSVLAVGLIDNFLRPVLLHRSISIHPFLVLLSVIGGFSVFGAMGFVFGPVILSVLVTLYEIYSQHLANNFNNSKKA